MKVSRTAYLRTAGLVLITATALVAGACSSDSGTENAGTAAGTASENGAFPVSIPSALGTAEIPEEPQRVVTLGWGAEDAALALGVVPIAVQDMSSDSGSDDGLLPWSRETLEKVDPEAEPTLLKASSKEIPFEQIAELAPDLVLATHSGLTQEQYDKLDEIAPTVAYPERRWATSWEDQITVAGEALGRSEKAEELIASTNATIAKTKEEHPEFASKTVAFGSATEAGSFNFYFDTDPRMKLLASLGFTMDPLAQQLREAGDPTKFAGPVSMELLPTYQPDVLLAWYLSPDMQRDVEGSPLFKEMKSVQSNSYIGLTDPPLVFASSSPNVLNIPWMLEQLTPQLSEAANNVPQD